MAGTFTQFARLLCRPALLAAGTVVILLPVLAQPTAARGPDAIADVAEMVIDAVVNISTSQTVDA
jgi:serine protease Do